MNILREFVRNLQEIKKNKIIYAFLFFQFVFYSNLVRQFSTDEFLVANTILTGWLCLIYKKITPTELRTLSFVLIIFASINMIPIIFFGTDLRLLLGYNLRIILGFFIIVYLKDNFFEVFEKLVFVLAFISLPLYIIQLVHVPVFDIFQGFSDSVLSESRTMSGRGEAISGHRYILIFLVNGWALIRNSGFMPEPAMYAAILSWAILFNVFINNFSMNPRLIVLFVAAVSSFSTGGFVYLSIFALIYLSLNFSNKNAMYFLMLISLIFPMYKNFDFVQKNVAGVQHRIESEQERALRIAAGTERQRVSRVGGFIGNIKKIIYEPFGFGLRHNIDLKHGLYSSPNGLMILLRYWGIPILIILLLCSYKVIKILKKKFCVKFSYFHTALLMSIIILPIGGNPIYNRPLLISLLLSGLIIKAKGRAKSCISVSNQKKDILGYRSIACEKHI